MMFYHGQGDFAERYTEVLHPFTDRGVRCIITDLPGHGYSPGKRGHSGNQMVLDSLILDGLAEADGLPCGIGGHSMGGMLAVRHALLVKRGVLPELAFLWLSSPLLKPSLRVPAWQLKLIPLLAPLMPSLTIPTGVTREMCRDDHDGGDEESSAPRFQLWHGKVSIGWGSFLLEEEQKINRELRGEPWKAAPQILITQGADDPVCPPSYGREFSSLLAKLAGQQCVSYQEIEGVLHEPFMGEKSYRVFAVLDDWLDGVLREM